MADPRLIIDLDALRANAATLIGGLRRSGIDTWAVTKVVCADARVAGVFRAAGASALADSRLANLETLRSAGLGGPFILLRIASPSDADDILRLADLSLQSEITTLEALNRAAARAGTRHPVLVMADLGDLREGVPAEEFPAFIRRAATLDHIDIRGIGTNLTCYGGVIPDEANLGQLVELRRESESILGRSIPILSGGNSSSLHLWSSGTIPAGVTNLRLGEALMLGRETAFGKDIPGTRQDAFTLRARVVELKRKPSKPIGTIGMDAFGRTPSFTDRGHRLRAIVSLGEQDVNSGGLTPLLPGAMILGASSDHLIVDVEDCDPSAVTLGADLDFRPDYGALLKASTSAYVVKEYRDSTAA
jgi:predicted amino acid racemase